jgi:hypothetical protein
MVDLNRLHQEAERAIRSAFPDDEAPSPAAMRNDHCPECQETAARFTGKRWCALAAGDLLGNPAPGFLSAPGFRYYLPALMLLSMEFPVELDCLPEGVIGVLSPKGTSPSSKDAERLRFTRAQAHAIVGFLRFYELRKKLEWSQPDWPDEAILAVPTERPLERAIEFWTARASEDAA